MISQVSSRIRPVDPDELMRLREQARSILRDNRFDATIEGLAEGRLSLERLLEELHLFHAELALQQESLRDSQCATERALARFARLYRELPSPALRIGWQGDIRDANSAARERLTLDCQLFIHLAAPDHIERLEALLTQARGGSRATAQEIHLRGRDGQTLIADLTFIRLPGNDGDEDELVCSLVDQTQQIKRRDALAAANRRLQLQSDVIDASSTVAFHWRHAPGWPILYVSPNVERWGYPVAELIAGTRLYLDLVHPEDRERLQTDLETSLAAGRATIQETYRIIWADGSEHWVESETSPVYGDDGTPLRYRGVVTDISARRRIELALHEHERLLQMAASLARFGGWEVDLVKNQVIWSDEVCRIHDEPSGTQVRIEEGIAYYAPEWRARITEVFTTCAREGIGYDEELQILSATGRRVWVRAIGEPVRDSTGRIIAVRGAFQDISDRKRAEERLRLLAAVFENTSQGILITDTRPRIIAVNRAFTEINGYTPEDLLGRNPSLLQSGRHDTAFMQALWRDLIERGQWRGELWNRRKDGGISPQWVNINTVHAESGEVTHYIGVYSDISDIKRSEAQIERLAHRDPLTDLPNRLLFRTRLDQAVLSAAANANRVGVLVVDIDGFRHINDSLGHGCGDLTLREVACRLTQLIRADETVARLSGDEFGLLLTDEDDIATHVERIAERILEALSPPLVIDGQEI